MTNEGRLALHYAARCLERLECYSAMPVQIAILQRMELALLRRHLDRLEVAIEPATPRARWLQVRLWLRWRLVMARQTVWEWRHRAEIAAWEREWEAEE